VRAPLIAPRFVKLFSGDIKVSPSDRRMIECWCQMFIFGMPFPEDLTHQIGFSVSSLLTYNMYCEPIATKHSSFDFWWSCDAHHIEGAESDRSRSRDTPNREENLRDGPMTCGGNL